MIKKISNRIKVKFTPLVLISVFILIPQGTTANLVICFEEDGHINVEPAHYGVCCPAVRASLSESHCCSSFLRNSFGESHCHPCKDVAITNGDLEQRIVPVQIKIKLLKALLLVVFTNQLAHETRVTSNELPIPLLHAGNSILAFLSSIVLLI